MSEFLLLLTVGEHWRSIAVTVLVAAVAFGAGWVVGRSVPRVEAFDAHAPEVLDAPPLPPKQDPADCFCASHSD